MILTKKEYLLHLTYIKYLILMNIKLKKLFYRILISITIFIINVIFIKNEFLKYFLFILSYLIVGFDILIKSIKNIKNGEIFDENFLMILATFGSFFLKDYTEAVIIILFYQIGEFFQSYAVNNSEKSITELINIRPNYANILVNNKIKQVDPKNINVGDIIIVKPGEKIPLDGIVVDGNSLINTSALTGESVPQNISINDKVLSGSINLSKPLKIKVSTTFSNSMASKIIDLIKNATNKKAKIENFITKFAKYYTPIIIIISFILAIFPPLFFMNEKFNIWLYRSIIFIVLSCPCALVISIPLSFFAGIGISSKYGILIKGSNFLEILSKTKYFVFDKTGTITDGNFKLLSIHPINITKNELLEKITYAEFYFNHPIAESIKKEYKKIIDVSRIKKIEELRGLGVLAKIDNDKIYIGNSKLMEKINIKISTVNSIETTLHVVINKKYCGYILIGDKIRKNVHQTVKELYKLGAKKIIILSGDKKNITDNIAKKISINESYSELLPLDKVKKMEEIMNNKTQNDKVAFIGDGINDIPVLMTADIGIAMGGIGSDSTIETADIVIMNDKLTKIPLAIKIAQKTIKTAKQNISFSLFTKLVVLILGSIGYTSIWMAIFADVGISIIAVLNSVKILYFSPDKNLN